MNKDEGFIKLTQGFRKGFLGQRTYKNLEGWLSEPEGFLLYLYSFMNNMGEIVEIGSFKGKSTCYLASGIKDSNKKTKVNAVDPHKGSPEFKLGEKYMGAGIWNGDSFKDFIKNLEDNKLKEYVKPIVKTSDEAVKTWKNKIGLLFIDGDHAYESARKDFINWTKFIPIGGTVMLHDTVTWRGPKAVVDELINGNPKWISFRVDSLTVATKVK